MSMTWQAYLHNITGMQDVTPCGWHTDVYSFAMLAGASIKCHATQQCSCIVNLEIHTNAPIYVRQRNLKLPAAKVWVDCTLQQQVRIN